MIHLDQTCSQIHYNQAHHCTIHTWKGFCFDQEYRNAMNQCLEVINQMGSTAVMINVQSVKDLEDDYDHLWTRFEWLPQLLQTNVRKIAVIVPKDFLAILPGQHVHIPVADQWITGRFFDNTDDAFQWIRYYL